MEGLVGRLTVSCTVKLIWLALTFSALWFMVLDRELRWGRGDDNAHPRVVTTVADGSKLGWVASRRLEAVIVSDAFPIIANAIGAKSDV